MFWKSLNKTEAERTAADAQAKAAALAYFRQAAAAQADDARAVVVGADEQGRVVRIEHGSSRPRRRCWYRIAHDGALLAELTLEQVAPYGETTWR
jgi:hypothetical protein